MVKNGLPTNGHLIAFVVFDTSGQSGNVSQVAKRKKLFFEAKSFWALRFSEARSEKKKTARQKKGKKGFIAETVSHLLPYVLFDIQSTFISLYVQL
jgi:hypothetical protein